MIRNMFARLRALVKILIIQNCLSRVTLFFIYFLLSCCSYHFRPSINLSSYIYLCTNLEEFKKSNKSLKYEELLALGDPNHVLQLPDDEWDAISLNYTSGTTGNPKGVVSHHR